MSYHPRQPEQNALCSLGHMPPALHPSNQVPMGTMRNRHGDTVVALDTPQNRVALEMRSGVTGSGRHAGQLQPPCAWYPAHVHIHNTRHKLESVRCMIFFWKLVQVAPPKLNYTFLCVQF